MVLRKRQLVTSALVLALGAAVFVNWYYAKPRVQATTTTDVSVTEAAENLGDAQYVLSDVSGRQDPFAAARLKRERAHDTALETLQEIHDKLETLLGREGAFLDGIYYCPHHPDRGFPGERAAYKGPCDCRKPLPGLLRRAAADFHIDLEQSLMIGDREADVQTGINAGCKRSLLVETNRENALLELTQAVLGAK